MKSLARGWKYGLVVIGLAVLLLMVMDFSGRVTELRRLTAKLDRIGATATSYVATIASLETQVAYATSEAAVHEYAREQGNMAQSEDVVIKPLAPPNSTPAPTPTVIVTPQVVSNWDLWWALFFGPPTP
jgi:cell division protein FtsB